MESVKDRFLRYVKIDTQSQHHVDKVPSTDKQLDLSRLLRDELPDCIVVSVSHRSTVERHHRRQLELLGGGPWRFTHL